LAKLKIKSQGKSLIKRILFSSTAAITIDIFLFMTLAFYGTLPDSLFIKILTAAYVKKLICEIFCLPFILLFIDKIKQLEGFEIYDISTNFNPFSIENVYDINSYKEVLKNKQIKT
jgi:hypothetical protein